MQSVECSVDPSSLNCINLDLMQLGHTQPQLPAPEWTDFVGPQHHSQELSFQDFGLRNTTLK